MPQFKDPLLNREALVALLTGADRFRRRVTEILHPFGLTLQQYNVLRILRGAGSEGIPTLVVGERMMENTPGITRLMDRLEKRGWVRRRRCGEDRRRVYCNITPAGLALLAESDAPVDAGDQAAFQGLSEDELREFIRMVNLIRPKADGSGFQKKLDSQP